LVEPYQRLFEHVGYPERPDARPTEACTSSRVALALDRRARPRHSLYTRAAVPSFEHGTSTLTGRSTPATTAHFPRRHVAASAVVTRWRLKFQWLDKCATWLSSHS